MGYRATQQASSGGEKCQSLTRRAAPSDAANFTVPVYSIDEVTLDSVAAHSYAAGTVMAKITANGEWIERDTDASDGSEVAGRVLLNNVDVEITVDKQAAMIVRHATVNEPASVKVGEDAGRQAAGIVELARRWNYRSRRRIRLKGRQRKCH